VHVVYYNTMNSVDRTGVDLYYANSDDGGVTWNTEERISTVTSENITHAQEWGDYNGISVVDNKIVTTWTDNRPPGSTSTADAFAGVMTLAITKAIVWVDFTASPGGLGTQSSPYNTLAEAVSEVNTSGTIKVKGDTAQNTSSEALTIAKALRVRAVSGVVQVGVITREASQVSTRFMKQLDTLRASFGADPEPSPTNIEDASELVLPFSMDGAADSKTSRAMALRLRNVRDEEADNIWSQANQSPFINGFAQTTLTGPSTQDIWVTFRTDEVEFLEGVITLTGARGQDSTGIDALVDPLGEPLDLGGIAEYDPPLRVWLPLPPGMPSNLAKLYYYQPSGMDKGWYPAEEVPNWLVEDSAVRMTIESVTYLGFLVRHAGIVQLAY